MYYANGAGCQGVDIVHNTRVVKLDLFFLIGMIIQSTGLAMMLQTRGLLLHFIEAYY